jgi:hypothetical protein
MPWTSPQGQTYTDQQIHDFVAGGGDLNQFLQQQGITNLDEIHNLYTQAMGIAGKDAPTGDAALQNYFKTYQKYNPNGAYANSYSGWLGDQGAGTLNAMRNGTYSGASYSPIDSAPGGIYAPGTGHDFSYAQSGLGARGMGDGWTAGAAPLGTEPQTSQPMMVNGNGALTYAATGTSTSPTQGQPGWVQPPQGSVSNPSTPGQVGSSLVGSAGSAPAGGGGGGALSQITVDNHVNPYQHMYRPDQQGPWMNFHSDGQPSAPPIEFHPQPTSNFYSAIQNAQPQADPTAAHATGALTQAGV